MLDQSARLSLPPTGTPARLAEAGTLGYILLWEEFG
jgi:hypothetical protein